MSSALEEAKEGVKTLMLDKQFGDARNEIVIEEFMTGREVSVLALCDGKTIKCMTSAQDHKRAKDGDQGLKPFLRPLNRCLLNSAALLSGNIWCNPSQISSR